MNNLKETEENIAHKFIDAINEGDVRKIHNLMTEDHIFIDLSGDIHKGKKEVNWKEYFRIFPDYKIIIEKTVFKNDYVYLLGHSEGDFSDYGKKLFTKNGKEQVAQDYQGPGLWRAKVKDDKIKKGKIFNYDQETLKNEGIFDFD